MLDFSALQAGAQYRRDQLMAEAVQARLLRRLPPAGPSRRGRLASLLVARTVLLLVLAGGALSPSAAGWPVGCWVPGDPAAVAQTLCGGR